jgi:hypothetical protein
MQTHPYRRSGSWVILRFALPVLAALCVLWTGYVAATRHRYETANGVPGEILTGENVGQTFIARYDGLSGVEVHVATLGLEANPGRATLVMHLRADPASSVDLATVTIPPSQTLDPDPWYTFSFSPIEHSRDRSYFLIVESPDGVPGKSLTVLWFQPAPRGDPYADGAAYKDGQPTKGDLAFGLLYSAPPLQVWTVMLGEAGANTSPFLLYGLLFFALLAVILAIVSPYLPTRFPRLAERLKTSSLAAALAVGLIYGSLFIVIMPPWQGPDEYAHFAYVALLDKHDLNAREVQALDLFGADSDAALIKAVNASADRNDFIRRLAGNSAPGAPTRTDAFLFQQVRQPPSYYWLCALALWAARTIGIAADPYTQPETAVYVMRIVSLVLGLLVIALAWVFSARLRAASAPLPAMLALLPMHTFIATSINNDILAELAVSALFVALAALYATSFGAPKEDSSRTRGREATLLLLCVVLAAAGVATKATASAASLPLLGAGLILWGIFKLYGQARTRPGRPVTSLFRRPPVVVLGAIVLAVGAFFVVCGPDSARALGWVTSYTPVQRIERVESSTAHDGHYVIQLDTAAAHTAMQKLIPPFIYHPALRITFVGWARLAPQQSGPPGGVAARLAVEDGVREAGVVTTPLTPGGDWTRMEVTAVVEQNAEQVSLQIGADPPGIVQFDDLSLNVKGVNQPWNDPIYKAALLDPSGENAPWTVRAPFSSLVPGDVLDMADALLNPQPFSKPALWLAYASTQYRSFWGSFGWLSINLPEPFYLLIGIVLVLALWGLLLRAMSPRSHDMGWRGLLAIVSVFALAAAIFTSFAKQMALTAYGGLPSDPQGRYLFVLAIPTVWLIIAGLGALARRLPPRAQILCRYVATGGLVFFAAYSLLALIVPYYYR